MNLVKFDPFVEGNKGMFEVGHRIDGLCNLWRIAPVQSTEDNIKDGMPFMVMRWVVATVFDPASHRWNPTKSYLEEV